MTTATTSPLYRELASLVQARLNCIDSGNPDWHSKHEHAIRTLVADHLPTGSGIDSGTTIDLDTSTGEKLVFDFSYHHMHDSGMYDGWTEHRAIVTPSLLSGFDIRITGRDRNQIKDYLHDVFCNALTEMVGS